MLGTFSPSSGILIKNSTKLYLNKMYQIKTKKEVFAGFMLCLTDTEMLTQLLLKPPLQATMLKKTC